MAHSATLGLLFLALLLLCLPAVIIRISSRRARWRDGDDETQEFRIERRPGSQGAGAPGSESSSTISKDNPLTQDTVGGGSAAAGSNGGPAPVVQGTGRRYPLRRWKWCARYEHVRLQSIAGIADISSTSNALTADVTTTIATSSSLGPTTDAAMTTAAGAMQATATEAGSTSATTEAASSALIATSQTAMASSSLSTGTEALTTSAERTTIMASLATLSSTSALPDPTDITTATTSTGSGGPVISASSTSLDETVATASGGPVTEASSTSTADATTGSIDTSVTTAATVSTPAAGVTTTASTGAIAIIGTVTAGATALAQTTPPPGQQSSVLSSGPTLDTAQVSTQMAAAQASAQTTAAASVSTSFASAAAATASVVGSTGILATGIPIPSTSSSPASSPLPSALSPGEEQREHTGSITVTGTTTIDRSWTSPAVVIYVGENASVNVNGDAQVGGVAIIELTGGQASITDTQRRVLVTASGGLQGAYNRVELSGQHRDAGGKCFSYMAVSQEQQGSSLSVLLVPREEQCKSNGRSSAWVVGGVVMGVIGGLLITLGVLWVGRDIFQNWARGAPDEDEVNLIT